MRLVAVAQVSGQPRPLDLGLGALQRLVNAIAQDDPLRAHPDVVREQPLHRPHRHALCPREVRDPPDLPVLADPLGQVHRERRLRILPRPHREQEPVERGDPLVLVLHREHQLRGNAGRRIHGKSVLATSGDSVCVTLNMR